MQLADAFNHDARSASAGHFRAHLVQAVGNVDDLGFAGCVVDDGGALGKGRCHQGNVGAADGDLRKIDLRTDESAGCLCDHVAAVDLQLGAELFQRVDQKIDRTGADGTAAGQRDLGLMHAGEQRRDHPEAGAHLGDQIIGSSRVDDVGC